MWLLSSDKERLVDLSTGIVIDVVDYGYMDYDDKPNWCIVVRKLDYTSEEGEIMASGMKEKEAKDKLAGLANHLNARAL